MKRKKQLVLIALFLSALLGASLATTQPARADLSCELQLWEDFLNANSTYTTRFQSWYFGRPVSCQTECTPQCEHLSGSEKTECLNTCINSCNSTRFTAFQGSQDNLLDVARRRCPMTLDMCAAARERRDICNSTYLFRLANPELDANGNYDLTWLSHVFEEQTSCIESSGIWACE